MNFENKQRSLLTFRVGPVLCCAPSLQVQSIIVPPKLTRIAGSEPSQPGIFKHGSHIVKVLDLRQKFGVEQSDQTQPGNLIVTICEKENVAFWVDQILDVFDFPTEGWGNLPAAIPRGVFTRTLLLNNKIHLYSEFEKLITISNLGYLKQYIQLLTQDEQKISPPEKPKNSDIEIIKKPELIKKTEVNKNITPLLTEAAPVRKEETLNQPIKKVSPQPVKKHVQQKPVQTSSTQKSRPNKIITKTNSHLINEKTPAVTKTKAEDNKYVSPQITSPTITTEEDAEPSLATTLVILFFILASLIGGAYYLLTKNIKSSHSTNIEKAEENSELYSNYNQTQPSDAVAETVSIAEIEPDIVLKESESTIISIEPERDVVTNVNTPSDDDSKYRAEISHDDNEITITIHQPETEEIPQPVTNKISPLKINDEIKNEPVISEPAVEVIKPKEFPALEFEKKFIPEVIHTVVKGDTLWAIAKKYVNDPFLYPELALLSNIKNPHRIYPGNRVRIRFIKK